MAWTENCPPNRQGIVRVRGAYRDANKQVRRQTFDHAKAALRWANAREQEVLEGSKHDPHKGRITYGAWSEKWWPSRLMEGGTENSQLSLRDNHVLPRWRDVPLNNIEHRDIQAWLNSLTKKLSASSARSCYYQLSAALRAATPAVIPSSPCVNIRLPTLPSAPERYLTYDEVDALFLHFDEVWRLLVEVLLETGMRIGEAVALHRHRIDRGRGTIDIVERWDRYTHQVVPYTKGKRRRTVPLTDRLDGLLGIWYTTHPSDARDCGHEHARGSVCHSGLLMPSPRDKVIDPQDFSCKRWIRGIELSEIGHARIHDLRHTYASRIVTAGVSLAVLQKLLGHSSIKTTERYAHLMTDSHDEVRRALAARPEGADQGANAVTQLDTVRHKKMERNHARPAKLGKADIAR